MVYVVTGMEAATTMNQKIERNIPLKRGTDITIRAGTRPTPPTSRIKLIIGTTTTTAVEPLTTPAL